MILFHGTNTDIETIDLTRSLNHKDFGKGFYLNKFLDQQYYFGSEKALRYLKKTNVQLL